ncbi:MAG: hypothetical protein QOE11_3641 [Solirubrobacteraceae bacterium]|jgi:hypothetical protein|nr:hypothetical protein [Solirubrobacteraceae bacterium]
MSARNWTLPARCALAAATLSIAIALVPAAALASGPGVTVIGRGLDQPLTLSGAEISSGGDVSSTTYTVRSRPGSATKITLSGMSVASVLARAGIDISSIRKVAVSRVDGSDLVLTRADIQSPPFPEGPAVISDDGSGTRILRPVRNSRDVNARDNIVSVSSGPLVLRVDDATSLSVTAKASPTQVRVGGNVTFTASAPNGGGGVTYHWDFGDGATDEGPRVTHSFDIAAEAQVQVTAVGSCANYCLGVDTVTVRVGDPNAGPNAPGATNPGSGNGNPQAPGTGTGTGGGGTGGSGGGDTAGATGSASVQEVVRELARQRAAAQAQERERLLAPKRAAAKRKRQAAKRKLQAAEKAAAAQRAAADAKAGIVQVTGILLSGQGTPISGGLPALGGKPSGTPKGPQAARGTNLDNPPSVPAALGLALLVISMGALRERRLVRLRVA